MYKSVTRDVLVLPSGSHGYSSGYSSGFLDVGGLVELGINFIPDGSVLEFTVIDGNTNGATSFTLDATAYVSVGVGFPAPYNFSFGDRIQVNVNNPGGGTPSFSLSIKGK